ncbi:MAG: D-gamma-glutamyl-meso-diaminopimelic acid endopeptidase CwlS precursor [Pelotomaculum sp. PtaB.Bin104]|uniref:NlpC/P60 family protein n=1 Tax=Pelotomaculum isophthalicicum JI TaxID=947010 RepID=A0A9X4JVS6_9FIRM|nr:NlpC/P60 family protein [Pelotomaculum isophthalicicum]MDF9407918.1 NlpC/P60 family protein [Pelotomaculum isophthalicicum JI]OPX93362.1 MAG: D-gamma-glutamyl-meso-diaminopimelic acid endopeptidase CwlS precursor [Pelotomaculum sp. PtaB.Bin104]
MSKRKLSISLSIFLLVTFLTATAVYAGQALKEGASGNDVLKVQTKLQSYGYYDSALDGDFGPATLNAVIRFQADCGLTVDGIVGPETIQALERFNPATFTPSRGAAGDRKGQTIVSYAEQFLGTPYVWAGGSPRGFDCSGFTSYVFGHFGIDLPHAADEQFDEGYRVSQPRAGDLVFFSTYESGPSHVGIYIGDNQFIHGSSGAGEVCITSLSTPYYRERYLGARRVIS